MKKNKLDLVSCSNCRFYRHDIINSNSEMWSCTKGNSVNIAGLDTKANKPCYQSKRFRRFKKNK